jgi:hypothetical protein
MLTIYAITGTLHSLVLPNIASSLLFTGRVAQRDASYPMGLYAFLHNVLPTTTGTLWYMDCGDTVPAVVT